MDRGLIAGWSLRAAVGGLLLGAVHAGAQVPPLADPTRPPPDLVSHAAIPGSMTPAGPVLSVIVLAADRKYAVIDGRTVPLGARFGNARLAQLTATEAVLVEGGVRTVIRLLPAVDKAAAGGNLTTAEGRRRAQ